MGLPSFAQDSYDGQMADATNVNLFQWITAILLAALLVGCTAEQQAPSPAMFPSLGSGSETCSTGGVVHETVPRFLQLAGMDIDYGPRLTDIQLGLRGDPQNATGLRIVISAVVAGDEGPEIQLTNDGFAWEALLTRATGDEFPLEPPEWSKASARLTFLTRLLGIDPASAEWSVATYEADGSAAVDSLSC